MNSMPIYYFLFFFNFVIFLFITMPLFVSLFLNFLFILLLLFEHLLLDLASVFRSIPPSSPSSVMNESDVFLPEASGTKCVAHSLDSGLNENKRGFRTRITLFCMHLILKLKVPHVVDAWV